MNRAGFLSIVLAAALTGACGGAEDPSSSPTGPSSTPPPASTPAPPPPSNNNNACISAPTNLRVVSIQGTSVTLAWNGVSGATRYTVLVGSASGTSDQSQDNTSQTTHTWTAKTGRQYARVYATASCGDSGTSNEIEYTVG